MASRKKAQVDIQFNWIFVIIAGAIILMFFMTIVFKNMGQSESKVSRKVVDQLVAIFAGAEVATSTAQEIATPEMQLNFLCEESGLSEFNIQNTGISKQIPSAVVFAPDKVKGRKVITWSLDWSVPYRVTNFLYVTSPLMRYYFIGTDTFNLLEDLPREDMMTREISPTLPEKILDKNNYKVKFIFFDANIQGNIESKLKINKEDVSAVSLAPDKITFYRYNGESFVQDGEPLPYLTKSELYAAIFSEDRAAYVCNMKKAFRRLEQVSRVVGARAKLLNTDACNYNSAESVLYQESINNPSINSMQLAARTCQISVNFANCKYSILADNIKKLNAKNRQLEYASCPLIY